MSKETWQLIEQFRFDRNKTVAVETQTVMKQLSLNIKLNNKIAFWNTMYKQMHLKRKMQKEIVL